MLETLLAGAMLGLSVAMPFGPVSMICVQRCLTHGFRVGLTAGIGAAGAHGVFALATVAAAGAIATDLEHWNDWIRLASAVLLIILGIRTLLRHRSKPVERPVGRGEAFGATLVLALSNPMTMLPYLAVATGATASGGLGISLSTWAVPGVMAGAGLWYFILISGAAVFGARLPRGVLAHLNLVSGSLLIVFGGSIAWR